MSPLAAYRWDGTRAVLLHGIGGTQVLSYDWSETNLPYATTDENRLSLRTEGIPAGTQIIDYTPVAGTSFRARVLQIVNALPSGSRAVIRLPGGVVYHLSEFVPTAANYTSGNYGAMTDAEWLYGFGLYAGSKFQGFLCTDPDLAIIQMDANSMKPEQLAAIARMEGGSNGAVLQLRVMRVDGWTDSPVILSGIEFRAADQQAIPAFHASNNIAGNQPAPHGGVQLFDYRTGVPGNSDLSYIVQGCRFVGAAKAATSMPPFELKSLGIDKGSGIVRRCEFDGRRHPDLDPTRRRVCSNVAGNSEKLQIIEDCWLHSSNVSRYAANDQGVRRTPPGEYIIRRCKTEQISNVNNYGLGGGTNATPFGWESTDADILVEDCIVHQDNSSTSGGQIAQIFQLTAVNNINPQGGRFTARRITTRNVWSQLDGWICMRITASYWITDGYATTLHIEGDHGQRLIPYVYTGTWPPTTAQLAAIGTPDTHYLIRNS